MKLPNILKNNKGMAIEMAIVTFIVVFALCTILTLFTVKSKNYVYFSNNRIKEKVYIDSIADSYMSHLNYNSAFDPNSFEFISKKDKTKFRIETKDSFMEGNEYIKIIDTKTRLTVEFEYDLATKKYNVIRWVYGD